MALYHPNLHNLSHLYLLVLAGACERFETFVRYIPLNSSESNQVLPHSGCLDYKASILQLNIRN